ncbi:MAG TPA: NAD-dependent epimerase/dehydratase family protein [Solirubrobacterales bacterium]|nr:NAD-dependent epimerase/dehydratase family protein [Solirubrobacterales bacterium]
MRLLVTGATGKVGNAVARRLAERGDEVVALVRDVAAAREGLPAGVQLVRGDVTDPASVHRAAEGVEGVFNCMGIYEQWLPDDARFEEVNAQGALTVVAAARQAGARRVVHTSTFDVFHAEQGGTLDETQLADYPKGTSYERSKQRAEELVLGDAAAGIEVVIVNPAGVYGPGPWAGAGLDGVLRDVIRRRLPALPPGGLTLAHVDDVAAGHLAAFERGSPGERYILADGFATNAEIARAAVEEAGRGWVPPTIPVSVARGVAAAGERVAALIRRPPLLPAGQLHFLLWQARIDNTKAREELGVVFRPWQQGIRETVRWMAETGRV